MAITAKWQQADYFQSFHFSQFLQKIDTVKRGNFDRWGSFDQSGSFVKGAMVPTDPEVSFRC